MGWDKRLLLTFCLLGTAAYGGLCTYDKSVPGLPKASCHFPSCPEGIDCQPPTIEKASAVIDFKEPLMKWADFCPDRNLGPGPCWEVYVDFKAEFNATDPAGISAIGVHLAQEVSARRLFRKYVGTVTKKNTKGKWEMEGTMAAHVPPGQRLEIDVYELCARDGRNNEGCILPLRLKGMVLGE